MTLSPPKITNILKLTKRDHPELPECLKINVLLPQIQKIELELMVFCCLVFSVPSQPEINKKQDIKPSNILLDKDGTVKIGDLGLIIKVEKDDQEMSHCVVTRQYRAPELIFGSRFYGTAVDMWSVGVTLAEIALNGKRLFDSTGDVEQLQKIWEIRGTPNVYIYIYNIHF